MQGRLVDTGEKTRLHGIPASRLAEVALVGAIVLVALCLRWDRLQYTEFASDQAAAMVLAYDAVANGSLPIHGVNNSVG